MPNPVAARIIAITGTVKLRIANGAYSQAATPSVPYMNTPQVFQGMNTEVNVPPSSSERDKFLECRLFSIKVFKYILEGTTIEIYCSEHVAFVAKQDTIVAVIIPKVPFATLRICCMIALSIPVYSRTPANVMATIVNETVYIISIRPPRLKSESTISLFDSNT